MFVILQFYFQLNKRNLYSFLVFFFYDFYQIHAKLVLYSLSYIHMLTGLHQ